MTELWTRAALVFLFSVACDIILMQLTRPRPIVRGALAPYLGFALSLLVWFVLRPGQIPLPDAAFGLFLFTTFWIVLRLILVCSQNSITLWMLAELASAPRESLTFQELLDRLPNQSAVGARLEAMAAGGLLTISSDGGLELRSFGRGLAIATWTLRRTFRVGVS